MPSSWRCSVPRQSCYCVMFAILVQFDTHNIFRMVFPDIMHRPYLVLLAKNSPSSSNTISSLALVLAQLEVMMTEAGRMRAPQADPHK